MSIAMAQFFRRLWNDEAAFKTAMRSGFRFVVAFLGYLMDQGIIPTGVPGGGNKIGMFLIVLAFLVSAGKQNPSAAAAAGSEGATVRQAA